MTIYTVTATIHLPGGGVGGIRQDIEAGSPEEAIELVKANIRAEGGNADREDAVWAAGVTEEP